MFCWMLALTGCRISEALALTQDNIDFEAKHVIIRCLKKRGRRVFRAIPLPSDFLDALNRWVQELAPAEGRLWPWSRMTGYRRVCEVMKSADIHGGHASPKGLRHAFGVRALQANVPLTLVQKWLGHADIATTAIYTNVLGPEERQIAARMWRNRTGPERPSGLAEEAGPQPAQATGSHQPMVNEATDEGATRRRKPSHSNTHGSVKNTLNRLINKDISNALKFPVSDGERLPYCALLHYWI